MTRDTDMNSHLSCFLNWQNRELYDFRVNEMKRAMKNLSEREVKIINNYFGIDGEPMTLEIIGEEVGLTKERVRQIKESAIRKVRNNLGGIFDI